MGIEKMLPLPFSNRFLSSPLGGIRFYDNPQHCINSFEKLHRSFRIYSYLNSNIYFAYYNLFKIYSIINGLKHEVEKWTKPPEGGFFKDRLVVCIHGVNNNPVQFRSLLHEMHKDDLTKTDIFIPKVKDKGFAPLDEMVVPILEVIGEWAEKDDDKELVLVGVSNGARIAKAIEADLFLKGKRGNIKKLRVVSIVGANNGSSTVNRIRAIGFGWIFPKIFLNEMARFSNRNERLEREWKASISKSVGVEREFTFVASPHDSLVPDFASTLPSVGHFPAKYALLMGRGHSGVTSSAATVISQIILKAPNSHYRLKPFFYALITVKYFKILGRSR